MHLQVPAPLSTSSRILLLVYLALHGTVYGSYLATVVPEKRLGGGRGNLSTSFPSATLPLQYLPVCRPGSWLGNPVVTAASCSQTCNALSPCKMLQITLTFCSTGQFVLQCSTVIRTAMHGLSAVLCLASGQIVQLSQKSGLEESWGIVLSVALKCIVPPKDKRKRKVRFPLSPNTSSCFLSQTNKDRVAVCTRS